MVRIVHGTKSPQMVRNVYGTKSLVPLHIRCLVTCRHVLEQERRNVVWSIVNSVVYMLILALGILSFPGRGKCPHCICMYAPCYDYRCSVDNVTECRCTAPAWPDDIVLHIYCTYCWNATQNTPNRVLEPFTLTTWRRTIIVHHFNQLELKWRPKVSE